MNKTSISWVRGPNGAQGFTWNPAVGCKAVSPGCKLCYAARLASTRLAHLPQYAGLTKPERPTASGHLGHWTGEVRFFPEKLAEPLRRRKPAGIFVMDMGDIALLDDYQFDSVFGVMAACECTTLEGGPGHRFYLLTKRPDILRERLSKDRREAWAKSAVHWGGGENPDSLYDQVVFGPRVLPHVWIGTSVCTQKEADKNVPELLQTPAAVRFLSVEPMLEAVTLNNCLGYNDSWSGFIGPCPHGRDPWTRCDVCQVNEPGQVKGIDWVIVGGESGPRARPFHIEWARSIVKRCKAAGVACWVKQLGAVPVARGSRQLHWEWGESIGRKAKFSATDAMHPSSGDWLIHLSDRAGADIAEWPADLRVQQLPEVR